jgi:hypothetical protein
LQADLNLSDCELALIAESRINSDSASDESPPDLLSLILHLFDKVHLIFSSLAQAIAVALWALHCHLYEQYLHTPRLLIQSREKGCGKTLLLLCLEQLINEPLYSSRTSAAGIYRQLKRQPRTEFLLDEIENSSLWPLTVSC